MSESGNFAYITGGASGIGRAVTTMLVGRGAKVFIADRDIKGAEAFAEELNKTGKVAWTHVVDVVDWDQQVKAFEAALQEFGRIDYVYPIAGIGERASTLNRPAAKGFAKPDLAVVEVDLTAVLYTVSIAVQQFRRQEPNKRGFRGKIGCVASICGFYCAPTVPVYTAAKHAIVGYVRSWGKYLPEEKITMNAVCPNVIRTNISTSTFYDKLEEKGLLTPMQGLIEAFEAMLGESDVSGECFEIGPNGGYHIKSAPEYLDQESKECVRLIAERSHFLHEPRD